MYKKCLLSVSQSSMMTYFVKNFRYVNIRVVRVNEYSVWQINGAFILSFLYDRLLSVTYRLLSYRLLVFLPFYSSLFFMLVVHYENSIQNYWNFLSIAWCKDHTNTYRLVTRLYCTSIAHRFVLDLI